MKSNLKGWVQTNKMCAFISLHQQITRCALFRYSGLNISICNFHFSKPSDFQEVYHKKLTNKTPSLVEKKTIKII